MNKDLWTIAGYATIPTDQENIEELANSELTKKDNVTNMKDLAIVLGIRPDVIRASKILKLLDEMNEIDFDFIWSGQHYSENMKDTFFRQLKCPSS